MHLDLQSRLRLGVSSCLTGEAVRFDGGHRREHWLMDRLAAFSELVPVCPEAGLGVPRETMSLVRDRSGSIRTVGDESGSDHSAQLDEIAREQLDHLDLDRLDGWVFKGESPSCAIQPIALKGEAAERAPGRFAIAVLDRSSWLPTIDEEQLLVPALRRHFLERAFARAHWRALQATLPKDAATRDATVDEWSGRFELLLMARAGNPIPTARDTTDPARLQSLAHLLFAGLDRAPTHTGQVAALRRCVNELDVLEDEIQGLGILIREYEIGRIDVEVPRQLLRGLAARGGSTWLRSQRFLDPFPTAWRDASAPSLPFIPMTTRSGE